MPAIKNKSLFCVRCFFKHQRRDDMQKRNLYEERLTIWKVNNEEEAIKLAEEDAKKYASETDCQYLEFAQSYLLSGQQFRNGLEVFSLMRESNLGSERYLDRFFDTGDERQRS